MMDFVQSYNTPSRARYAPLVNGPHICNDMLGIKTIAINKFWVENVNMLQTFDTMLLRADGFDTHSNDYHIKQHRHVIMYM